jgi:hypothetical protein
VGVGRDVCSCTQSALSSARQPYSLKRRRCEACWRPSREVEDDAREWLSEYAQLLGTAPPDREQFETLLQLAAEAAHSSERLAGPVACWVAAKSGKPLAEALDVARALAASTADG